jgi:hypothetical protein
LAEDISASSSVNSRLYGEALTPATKDSKDLVGCWEFCVPSVFEYVRTSAQSAVLSRS